MKSRIKQTSVIVYALIALISMAGYVSAVAQPNILVSGFQVTDGEAAVGKNFVLTLNLTNTGATCAIGITSSIQLSPPFIMDGVSTIASDDLCYNSSETVDIPLRIDPTAQGGTYQISVINNYQDLLFNPYTASSVLNIFIDGSPKINAHITGTNPVDVYPGDDASITVTISNDGSFMAQAVNATLSADAPLIVKWSDSYSSLGTINARQSKNAQFTIEVPKNVEKTNFPMQLDISYLDQNLEPVTKILYIIFYTKSNAMFYATNSGSDTMSPNENSRKARFILNNTGTDVAKDIKLILQPQFPFSTDGSIRYISSLKPGESAPVEFIVDVDKDATIGDYGLKIIIDYTDSQGKDLQDSTYVSLAVQNKSILKTVFADYWFLWLIVVVGAIFLIRRRNKAQDAAKKTIKKK
jgi:hypothetical protein